MQKTGLSRHGAICAMIDAAAGAAPPTPGPGNTIAPKRPSKPTPAPPADDEWVPASQAMDTSMVPFNPPRPPMQKRSKSQGRGK